MRSWLPLILALACPIGMCLIPMLLMRRKGAEKKSADEPVDNQAKELHRLQTEVESLRAELSAPRPTELDPDTAERPT